MRSLKPCPIEQSCDDSCVASTTLGTNWSGNYAYRARALHRPRTLGELQGLLPMQRALRVARLAALVHVHRRQRGAGGAGRVARRDRGRSDGPDGDGAGRARPTRRWPRRSTARASRCTTWPRCRTSRWPARSPPGPTARVIAKGNLATAVRAVEMVGATGELVHRGLRRSGLRGRRRRSRGAGDRDPGRRWRSSRYYEMRQRVFQGVSWDTLFARFDDIYGAGESVSVFHLCGERTEQVWVKRLADGSGGEDDRDRRPRGAPRRPAGDDRASPRAGRRPRQLHRAAGRARAVV